MVTLTMGSQKKPETKAPADSKRDTWQRSATPVRVSHSARPTQRSAGLRGCATYMGAGAPTRGWGGVRGPEARASDINSISFGGGGSAPFPTASQTVRRYQINPYISCPMNTPNEAPRPVNRKYIWCYMTLA